jgi:hypothetical protein
MFTRGLSLALLLAAACPAHGGCAAIPPLSKAYESAPLIFRGRVLEAIPPAYSPTSVVPPGITHGSNFGPIDRVRFQVLETFKGDPGSEITLTGDDRVFGKGGEFLVFALANTQGGFAAAGCLHTNSVTNPQATEDLTWLRARLAPPPDKSNRKA